MVTHGDALTQLPQARIVEQVTKFGLTQKHYLEEFAIVGLKIRKQPHLFQQFVGQILRLIDDKHGVLAAFDLLQQKLVNDAEDIEPIESVDGKTKLQRDRLDEFFGAHHRIKNESGGVLPIQLL